MESKMQEQITLERILQLLMHPGELGRKAVGRALVALNNRQTIDEQREQETKYNNNKGFQKCHAKRGTSMAGYVERNGALTNAQWQWWTSPAPGGTRPRITIYASQLLAIALEKQGRC